MTTVKELNRVNGVDVATLKEKILAMRRNARLGSFQFRASNRWMEGTRNHSELRDFHGAEQDIAHQPPFALINDEPEVLGGGDRAPNPVEYLLHALAGCVTTTIVCHAASRGIEIESIESDVEGDIDVRGFLGIAEDVPKGFQTIRMKLRVKSDAPAEKLVELARYSPVYNTLTQPVKVELEVEKV